MSDSLILAKAVATDVGSAEAALLRWAASSLEVTAFWEEMDAAGANWHFHAYSGVKHGFTDPGSDARGVPAIGYDASADRQSWAALMGLFAEVF
jgi:dienelactone hydrolase